MKYCKKCITADTIPGRKLNSGGICRSCSYSEEVTSDINWDERVAKLHRIAEWAKANNNGGWDCAIGISGGKDSTFQALYAKDELKLNCLLVNCAPDGITEPGRKNLENLVSKGFDMVSWRNNPKIMKQLTKRSFYENGNPVKPSEYPLFAVTYQTALAYNIPLIIQGENPGLILGNTTAGDGDDDDAFDIVTGNTLQGGNADDWVGDGLSKEDLLLYQFPSKKLMVEKGIRAIYLQYYVKDWSSEHNIKFAVENGLSGREEIPGRLSRFGSVDSDMQIINPMIKYLKFGTSNYSDGLSKLIRVGKMTREKASILASKWDGHCPDNYIEMFCEYIGITVEEFWREMDEKWVNKKLFKKDEDGKWKPRFVVGTDFPEN